MDGVTILAVSQRMTTLNAALFGVGVAVAFTIAFAVLALFLADEPVLASLFSAALLLCVHFAYIAWDEPRVTVVKAILSQDVDWNELAERYEVLSVEGQIFEMRERQNETD